jgi:hypothetical protein
MWFAIIGLAAFAMGLLYLTSPRTIEKIDQIGNLNVFSTEKIIKNRIAIGIFHIISSAILICASLIIK